MWIDMWIDMRIDMRIGMWIGMWIGMRIDMRIGMWIGMWIDVLIGMYHNSACVTTSPSRFLCTCRYTCLHSRYTCLHTSTHIAAPSHIHKCVLTQAMHIGMYIDMRGDMCTIDHVHDRHVHRQ